MNVRPLIVIIGVLVTSMTVTCEKVYFKFFYWDIIGI